MRQVLIQIERIIKNFSMMFGKEKPMLFWCGSSIGSQEARENLINTLEEFNNLGVDFVSYKENIDTSTPSGKILFTMISAFAEFERAIIRERVIAGMEKAKARGARIGRPKIPPFTIKKVLEMKERDCTIRRSQRNLRSQNLLIITS